MPSHSKSTPKKPNPYARHQARKLLVQALYQWHLTQNELSAIEKYMREEWQKNKIDWDYFHELLHAIGKTIPELETHITPLLDRKLEELDIIERSVLRIATYELIYKIEIPYRIIINEALELTKAFGSVEGYKYVNAILDKLAQSIRSTEISS